MTSKLKAQFDAIELFNVIKPMLNTLDEVIEYTVENMDEEVSTLDIVDYITDCMQSHLEDTGMLSESDEFDTTLSREEIEDAIFDYGSESLAKEYIRYMLTPYTLERRMDWTIDQWEKDYDKYVLNSGITDEEVMQESFRRRAGL